jgi:hypothetical protein
MKRTKKGHDERKQVILEHIGEIAGDTFPDDDVEWKVLGIRHEGEYSFVESEPVPPTVGYPRFKFVLRFEAFGRVHDVGCYALVGDKWSLLAATPGAPQDWRSIEP